MTAKCWEEFTRARRATKWQEWLVIIVFAIIAGAAIGAALTMIWRGIMAVGA